VSSPSNFFECHWHASRQLLALYLLAWLLALVALMLARIPGWLAILGFLALGLVPFRTLPRHVRLTCRHAFTGIRRDALGWAVWSEAQGWQGIQLTPDSLALPLVIVLRFRLEGERRMRGVCIPRDALPREAHRRLRVMLKFSRRRWQATEQGSE
jgi:toxin CptA